MEIRPGSMIRHNMLSFPPHFREKVVRIEPFVVKLGTKEFVTGARTGVKTLFIGPQDVQYL